MDENADPSDDAGVSAGRLPLTRRAWLRLVGVVGGTGGLAASGSRRVAAQLPDDAWTVVALPDTQFYSENDNGELQHAQNQADWIANNHAAENIAFVTHEGDLVEHGGNGTEWDNIAGVMDTIDGAGVPYSTLPGNHDWADDDTHIDKSESIQNFKDHFGIPSGRYDEPWFGGFGPDSSDHNSNINAYQTFSAGGYDFLHLALEWRPSDTTSNPTPLEWAQGVVDAHPDKPTIVTTHEYIDIDGNRTQWGEDVFQAIVAPNAQVFLVLCGHLRPEGRNVATNDVGENVYEMLANYQQHKPNGGNGFLRRLEFRPGGGDGGTDRLQVRTYSPSIDQFDTDDSSEFHYDFSFSERFDPANWTPPETVTFQQGQDGYAGTVDTHIREYSPDSSFEDASELVVDTKDPQDQGTESQALIRFEDVFGGGSGQVPPGADITSATLTVETTNGSDGSGSDPGGGDVHRMVSTWEDTATWNDFGGDGVQADGTEAASDADDSTGTVTTGPTHVDVTESVQAWANGDANNGWAVLPTSEDGWDFYSAEGNELPKLEVNYKGGSSDTSPPSASFSYSPSSPYAGQSVDFDGSGSSDDSGIASYEWDFDADGAADATGETTSHTFSDVGDHQVTLTVEDGAGNTDSETQEVTVGPAPVCSSCNPPTDPDGDGKYEDVNGDGQVSYSDVVTLYHYFNGEFGPIEDSAHVAFDFNGDEQFTYSDVVALYHSL